MSNIVVAYTKAIITASLAEGFALAIKYARLGVKSAQPDMEVLKKLLPNYSKSTDNLIAASQVVATHFQTIATANNHWKDNESNGQ